MVFNSFEFLIFYPAVLLIHFLLPHRYRWISLLIASYYFYISWNPRLVFLILFTTAVSYFSSILIEKEHEKHSTGDGKTVNGSREKWLLVLTLAASLGVLFFFKYFNFLSSSVTGIVNIFRKAPSDPLILDLILPVGISFYTFQTLSYVIDVYRGNIAAEKHFGYYALYVSFFPQLVAGPIERPENLLPQLHADYRPQWSDTTAGLRMMLIGFFKKIAVADLLAPYVNSVYNDPENANGLGIVIATVMFAFQIYCDFAGYTDIAIGCARVMGIRLMQNFDRPYISGSIKEFWRRWHISLSSWFRDYIYFPLGGSRCARWRHMLNIVIVFLVSGLWHGADWAFVIWGLMHGLYQVIGYFTQKPRDKMWNALKIGADSAFVRYLRRFNTFVLVCFGWVFFRAGSVSGMSSFKALSIMLPKLFTDWSFTADYFTGTFEHMGLTLTAAVTAVLSLLVMRRLDITKLGTDSPDCLVMSKSRYVYIVWVIALAWMLLLVGDGASSFIYFQF